MTASWISAEEVIPKPGDWSAENYSVLPGVVIRWLKNLIILFPQPLSRVLRMVTCLILETGSSLFIMSQV